MKVIEPDVFRKPVVTDEAVYLKMMLGMIFAIPMMAVLYTLISEGVKKSLHHRGFEHIE